MKKVMGLKAKYVVFVTCVIAMLLLAITPIARAESVDLSTLSYEELITLNTQIQTEIMSRPEFKTVLVPPGAYKVGDEIPAGKWKITATEGMCEVYWGKTLDQYGVKIPYSSRIDDLDDWRSKSSVTWNLVEGTYIVVNRNAVTFTPATTVNLGF